MPTEDSDRRVPNPEEVPGPAGGSASPDAAAVDGVARETGAARFEAGSASLGGEESAVELVDYRYRAGDAVPEDHREAFASAAETWASLSDREGVLSLVDWGVEDGRPWLATEAMDADSLAERIADPSVVVWPDQALWTVGRVADVLAEAHAEGVHHHGLRPWSIGVRAAEDGTWDLPRVGDWGTRQFLVDDEGAAAGLDLQYAAPEQIDPDRFGEPDERTDVYRLGAVLYELLTRERPFEGTGYELVRKKLTGAPAPAPSEADPVVPEALDDVIARALASDPDDRYDDVAALRDAVESVDLPPAARSSGIAAEWRQAGGDPGRRSDAGDYRGDGDAPEGIWSDEIGGQADGSPAVAHGTVLVGGGGEAPTEFVDEDPEPYDQLVAYHPTTGDRRWSRRLDDHGGEVDLTPAVHDGTVYLPHEGTLHAIYVRDGETRWDRDLDADDALVLDRERDALYLADRAAGRVRAVDAADGERLWTADLDPAAEGRPTDLAAADGRLFVRAELDREDGIRQTRLHALNADTGAVAWSVVSEERETLGAPIAAHGRVYVTDDGAPVALDPDDGDRLWEADLLVDDAVHRVRGLPAAGEDALFAVADGTATTVFAIEADDGEVRWSFDTDEEDLGFASATQPVVADDLIYLAGKDSTTDEDVQLLTLWTENGAVEWHHETGATMETEPPAPTVVEDLALVPGDDQVFDSGDDETLFAVRAPELGEMPERESAAEPDYAGMVLEYVDEHATAKSRVARMTDVPEERIDEVLDELEAEGEIEVEYDDFEGEEVVKVPVEVDEMEVGEADVDRLVETLEETADGEMMADPEMVAMEVDPEWTPERGELVMEEAIERGRVQTRSMGGVEMLEPAPEGGAAGGGGGGGGGGDRPTAEDLRPHMDDPSMAEDYETIVERADPDGAVEFVDVMDEIDQQNWGMLTANGRIVQEGAETYVDLPAGVDFEFDG